MMKRTRILKARNNNQGNKGEKETCLAVTDIKVSLTCRHQGGQDYPWKEIEKEDPGQIEKRWHLRPKRMHHLIRLSGNVRGGAFTCLPIENEP
ncbi:MAG: hypothetical protein JSW15_01690 [Deltaproteobacteria bacterium]|nr:MAG: hypothetical protein JSW15_01690 [Deltaproteobacteria bacterium]